MCKKEKEPYSNLLANDLSVENLEKVVDKLKSEIKSTEPICFKPTHINICLPSKIATWIENRKANYNGLETMEDFRNALADFYIEEAHNNSLNQTERSKDNLSSG